ncbi:hypothetical protein BpHYR1_011386 [Brachionus plicatilis]|uniref:Uncharacterized protein n=1 Tax=Brachionus plicatilis TaxID=10195 RepID=A0A3M7SKJ0_BRAPC|nr:hypothetical protein BpHYR1_011386 [Brachionus plicatilis]
MEPKIKNIKKNFWWDKEMEELHVKMRYFLKIYKNSGYNDKFSNFNYKMYKKRFRNEQRKRIKEKEDKKAWMLNLSHKDSDKFWKTANKYRKKRKKTLISGEILEKSFNKLFNEKIIKESEQQRVHLMQIKKEILEYEEIIKDN